MIIQIRFLVVCVGLDMFLKKACVSVVKFWDVRTVNWKMRNVCFVRVDGIRIRI